MYNSVGGGNNKPSSSQWSRTSPSNLSKFKTAMQERTHGLTSEQLTHVQDPRSRVQGGEIGACITYEYEKDYIMESLM